MMPPRHWKEWLATKATNKALIYLNTLVHPDGASPQDYCPILSDEDSSFLAEEIERLLSAHGMEKLLRRESTIVDLGCGSARTISKLQEKHPNIVPVGVDRNPYHVHSNVRYVQADVGHLPLKKESADLVYSALIFPYIQGHGTFGSNLTVDGLLCAVDSLLCPGGIYIALDFNATAINRPFRRKGYKCLPYGIEGRIRRSIVSESRDNNRYKVSWLRARMKNYLFFSLICFVMFPVPADAWWNATHAALMVKTCNDFGCPFPDNVGEWANIPDDVFHDNARHICYNESWSCPESSRWDCPTKFKCPAEQQWTHWLDLAKNETEEESFWYDISIASHYYYDTQNFFHRVQNEGKCHSAFEKAVDEKIESKELWWSIERCGVEETYDSLVDYVHNYNALLEKELDLAWIEDTPLVECTFWCKVRSVFSFLFE